MSQTQQNSGRPLSPHLSVYKPQISSTLSILHRATGVALAVGVLVLAWWLVAIAGGAEAYDQFMVCMSSIPGKLVLLGFTVALNYHLLNGIRHLYWDTGRGFEIDSLHRTGWMVVIGTALLTVVEWALAYGMV